MRTLERPCHSIRCKKLCSRDVNICGERSVLVCAVMVIPILFFYIKDQVTQRLCTLAECVFCIQSGIFSMFQHNLQHNISFGLSVHLSVCTRIGGRGGSYR